jgi:hypothetical protein
MAIMAFVAGVAFYFVHREIDQEHDALMRLQEGTLLGTKKSTLPQEPDNQLIIIHSDDDHPK